MKNNSSIITRETEHLPKKNQTQNQASRSSTLNKNENENINIDDEMDFVYNCLITPSTTKTSLFQSIVCQFFLSVSVNFFLVMGKKNFG